MDNIDNKTTRGAWSGKKNLIIAVVVTLVIAGGGGFFGGIKYAQSKTPARGNFANGQRTGGAGAAGGAGRRFTGGANNFVSGKVLSSDGSSLTIQTQTGGSRIIIVPPSAMVGKVVAASSTDVSVGSNVIVTGTDNSDGSITAQNVQIRPDVPAMAPPAK